RHQDICDRWLGQLSRLEHYHRQDYCEDTPHSKTSTNKRCVTHLAAPIGCSAKRPPSPASRFGKGRKGSLSACFAERRLRTKRMINPTDSRLDHIKRTMPLTTPGD